MPLPIETVRGTPYEMGLQHGRIFRHLIHANVAQWAKRHTFEGRDELLDATLAGQRAIQEELCPWVFDELRGIAEGSGVELPWIERMHMRIWNVLPNAPYPGEATGCTIIGMRTPDGVAIGGMLDDPRASYVLLRRMPKYGIPHISTVWAGTAWGHNGCNAAGLAFAQASGGCFEGGRMPVADVELRIEMVMRMMLQTCSTVPEALAVAHNRRQGCSLVLGDATGNLVLHQEAAVASVLNADDADGMVYATNHMHLPAVVEHLTRHGITSVLTDYTRCRFEVLEQARSSVPRTVGALKELLRSHARYPHSICNNNSAWSNLMLPEKEPGVLHLCDKPPCRSEFTAYRVIE